MKKIRSKKIDVRVEHRDYIAVRSSVAATNDNDIWKTAATARAAARQLFTEIAETSTVLDIMTADIPAETIRAWAIAKSQAA